VTLFTAGALVLSFDPSERLLVSAGAVLIVLSCVFWALDNNISRTLSGDDPSFYVMVKGLTAGSFSFILSLLLGNGLPPAAYLLSGLLLGALAYGFSLALFMLSLRQVGAARTGTVFALSPFAGVAFSLLIFRTLPGWQFAAALPLMAVGFAFLLWETHTHPHVHEEVVHEHSHAQDEHHGHGHEGRVHAHEQCHDPVAHSHPHMPDMHHRHQH
jgi:drug/metabolite transporter (DMT)-like permease